MMKIVRQKDVRQPLTLPKRRVRVSQQLAAPLIFAELNDSTPGGECQKNACATR